VVVEIENNYSILLSKNKNRLTIALKTLENKHDLVVSSIKTDSDKEKEKLIKILKEKEERKDQLIKSIEEKNNIENNIKLSKNNITNCELLINNKSNEKFDDSVLISNGLKLRELRNKRLELNILEKEKNELIEIYYFWKTGYSMSGIPSMLIDEAIPFMNERIRFYLDQIGERYVVSFDTLNKNKGGEFKDKISINVYDSVTKANNRKQLSGGQTRIVDISTILTLRDLQSKIRDMKTNIIILDEIFDSLDTKNIEYVSSVLRNMTKGNSINIISHSQIDQLDVDETLRFL